MTFGRRPLWNVCTANNDVLSEGTASDFEFDYADISSVTTGHISSELQTLAFGEAPSRARRLAKPGDVIVSTVRTYLKAIAPVTEQERSRVYSTGFAVLRPNVELMNWRFFQYALLAKGFIDQIAAHSEGVSYPAINASDLMRLSVPTPELTDQHRIADFLDREAAEIDAMDAELDRLVETLRERRRTTIHEILSPLPTGRLWFAIGLSQTGPFGTQLAASEYVSGGIPVINPTHITPRGIMPDALVSVSHEKAKELSRHLLIPGDIVLGRKGEVDKASLVPSTLGPAVCGSDSMLIRVKEGVSLPEFMWWFFQSPECHLQLESMSVGSTVAGLNQTAIAHLWMPLPAAETQRRIVAELEERTARIDDMLADATRLKVLLAERRSTLITEVVTGVKEVPA